MGGHRGLPLHLRFGHQRIEMAFSNLLFSVDLVAYGARDRAIQSAVYSENKSKLENTPSEATSSL